MIRAFLLGELAPRLLKDLQRNRSEGLLAWGRVCESGLTKHQRYNQKKSPAQLLCWPQEQLPVCRCKPVLLRRSIAAYFREHELTHVHGARMNSLGAWQCRYRSGQARAKYACPKSHWRQ
jgi:hypothetical protein